MPSGRGRSRWRVCVLEPGGPCGGSESSALLDPLQMFTDEFFFLFPGLNWSLAAGTQRANENHFLYRELELAALRVQPVFSTFPALVDFFALFRRLLWPVMKVTLRKASNHVLQLIPASVTHERYQPLIISRLYLSIFFYIGAIAPYIYIYILYICTCCLLPSSLPLLYICR